MLFVLERGNLIILSLPLLGVLLSTKGKWRFLSLAVLINIKPYFLLLASADILLKRWRDLLFTGTLALLIYIFCGVMQGRDFYLMVNNLIGFSKSANLFSPYDVLTYPSSVSAYTYVINSEGFDYISSTYLKKLLGFSLEFLKYSSISFVIYMAIRSRKLLTEYMILFAATAILTNMGISAGGYSLVLYVAFIPFLMKMHYKNAFIFIFVLMTSSLDLINIFDSNLDGIQTVYLSGISIQHVQWHLVLGSALRPFLNIMILIFIGFEFRYTQQRSIKYGV